MKTGNLFSGIPTVLPQELMEDLLVGQRFRLERIVSKGHRSADDFWYDQAEDEWVLLFQGEARLELESQAENITLSAGMYLHLPAHVKHRVVWTHQEVETIWLAIFYSANSELLDETT
ncbi:cupin domain-containing protein [Spirosoma flavum]|uniref:Cupin domain-containing protein n=1 Tax=Spirosoma flavum TaxID=2048557 RepID=A0ABW6AFZ6_9BACT